MLIFHRYYNFFHINNCFIVFIINKFEYSESKEEIFFGCWVMVLGSGIFAYAINNIGTCLISKYLIW